MTQLIVDLGQLRDACQAVKVDTNVSLRNGLNDTDAKVHQGVQFGRTSPSGEVSAARGALSATLHRHVENSVGHLRRADQIVVFLERALVDYDDVDALKAADFTAIVSRLNDALPGVPRSPAVTGFQP
jgi:hypothetical protein